MDMNNAYCIINSKPKVTLVMALVMEEMYHNLDLK